MGAIAVALVIGAIAVGLVAAIIGLSTATLAGLKIVNALHDGSSWFLNRKR